MSTESQLFSLIPEDHLMESLSPLWQQRFNRAIDYLTQTIGQNPPPSWDEVAEYAAISPFHFHRMFSTVFQETPGHYLRRIRLQIVVYTLISQPNKSVTEIALDCGFASSQSMAKALRRVIETSASAIRNSYLKEGWDIIEQIFLRLGQPEKVSGTSLEKNMADNVQFLFIEMPERHFSVNSVSLKEYRFDEFIPRMAKKQDLYAFVKTIDADKSAEEQLQQLGYPVEKNQANLSLSAGKYLSCQVRLNSMVAYAAIWDALYIHTLSLDIALDPEGYCIETFHQTSDWQEGIYDMTLGPALPCPALI